MFMHQCLGNQRIEEFPQGTSLKGDLTHKSMKKLLPVAVPEDWGVRMERNCFDPQLGDGGFCLVGFVWFVIVGLGWYFFVCLGFLFSYSQKKNQNSASKEFVHPFVFRNSKSRALGKEQAGEEEASGIPSVAGLHRPQHIPSRTEEI